MLRLQDQKRSLRRPLITSMVDAHGKGSVLIFAVYADPRQAYALSSGARHLECDFIVARGVVLQSLSERIQNVFPLFFLLCFCFRHFGTDVGCHPVSVAPVFVR